MKNRQIVSALLGACIALWSMNLNPAVAGEPTTPETKIAIIQYQVQQDDQVGVDATRAERFVREAAANGARLIVLPETCLYRYSPWEQNGVTMGQLADEFDSLSKRFGALADQLNVCLVIGLREPHTDKTVYNTALFFGPNGRLLGKHHKTVPSISERVFTTPGKTAKAFETPLGRVGMLICKDAKSGHWKHAYDKQSIALYILIAGDDNGTSFTSFGPTCKSAHCYGILANQVTKHGKGKGNSAIGTPDGKVRFLGGGEKIFYETLPLKWHDVTTTVVKR